MTTSAANPAHAGHSAQSGKDREYEVLLVTHPDDEGYAVLCPALGCASQGDTREEALEMIADAISMWLDSYAEDGLEPPFIPDAMASAVAEYEADGCDTEVAYVRPADWDAIIAECNAAIQRNPNDAKAYIERAGAYLNKGEYDQVVVDCNAAISLAPNEAEAYCRRGDARFNSRQYDLAIADYDAALRRDPYYDIAYASMEAAYVGLWKQGKSD